MTIDIWVACYLLLAHFASDFLPQTHKIGTKKSGSNLVLTLHVFMVTIVLLILLLPFGFVTAATVAAINGVLHWPIDYCTSRISKYFYLQNKMTYFWKVIGIDQLIHTTILLVTYSYVA